MSARQGKSSMLRNLSLALAASVAIAFGASSAHAAARANERAAFPFIKKTRSEATRGITINNPVNISFIYLYNKRE